VRHLRTFVIDSISAVTGEMRGHIVVTGSHGGVSAAHLALAHPPALVVFNDAGVGLDDAGIRSLDILNAHGVAACTVGHLSACIGEADSTLRTGRISYANSRATASGIAAGQTCIDAINFFMKPLLDEGSAANNQKVDKH
jgi:hypothetical protein